MGMASIDPHVHSHRLLFCKRHFLLIRLAAQDSWRERRGERGKKIILSRRAAAAEKESCCRRSRIIIPPFFQQYAVIHCSTADLSLCRERGCLLFGSAQNNTALAKLPRFAPPIKRCRQGHHSPSIRTETAAYRRMSAKYWTKYT